MLFEATVQIKDQTEFELFDKFVSQIEELRRDPFAVATPARTDAAKRFDEAVPEAPAYPKVEGGTFTAKPLPGALLFNATPIETQQDEPPSREIPSDTPTEKDALAAFVAYAERKHHDPAALMSLLSAFNVKRVGELQPEQRARFIAEASNAK